MTSAWCVFGMCVSLFCMWPSQTVVMVSGAAPSSTRIQVWEESQSEVISRNGAKSLTLFYSGEGWPQPWDGTAIPLQGFRMHFSVSSLTQSCLAHMQIFHLLHSGLLIFWIRTMSAYIKCCKHQAWCVSGIWNEITEHICHSPGSYLFIFILFLNTVFVPLKYKWSAFHSNQ